MSQTFNKKTTKNQKPTVKADPQHNSFVYAEERIHESDKKRRPLGAKFITRFFKKPAFMVFAILALTAFYVGSTQGPSYTVQQVSIDLQTNQSGEMFYLYKGKPKAIDGVLPIENAQLTKENIKQLNNDVSTLPKTEFVKTKKIINGVETDVIYQLKLAQHFGIWSLLPAIVAIALCWLTREPVTSLFSGIIVGALLLQQYDITDAVLLEAMATKSAAGIMLLYLWLLGGLMGIWARTGAAKAFAELMTKHIVRGPRSAKFVAWILGVIFFQGGTMSTVLVGSTVKPIADKEKISHEELSYIVDSTASPIACLLAFNAWPGYVQAFMLVSGVGFLATETDRIQFFFSSVPFSFYAIFAVLGTLLLSFDKAPFLGKQMKAAIKRSRETGKLDAEGAKPLSAAELETSDVPAHYKPHVIDFFLPLTLLIGITIGTFVFMGSPKVRWGFGIAFMSAAVLALVRGMRLSEMIEGIGEGLKGVVLGSVILILAITIGGIAKSAGGGVYLVELLGSSIPFYLLPLILMTLTVVIAFSTGTSWGTYAVAFPLALPLAWSVAQNAGLANPKAYLMICFATVLNGSVMGDQCSPISDTTILSSMCTGCDLMDHVKTQMIPAGYAAGLALVCWTAATFLVA
ncbi:MAG: Na+/H+ antiporter NhaC family protein [Candidatus Margulisiibacteriota bacterium]|nr:Na+/H+ antiporter NhaC family protein [Candidatus Margulisiibacteriota bacterium]